MKWAEFHFDVLIIFCLLLFFVISCFLVYFAFCFCEAVSHFTSLSIYYLITPNGRFRIVILFSVKWSPQWRAVMPVLAQERWTDGWSLGQDWHYSVLGGILGYSD
jgi:hypothetical protein